MVSRRFIEAVKLADAPAYQIAHEADLHPATLSKLMSGQERVKPDDARVIAVGRVLGLSPEECLAERRVAPRKGLARPGPRQQRP